MAPYVGLYRLLEKVVFLITLCLTLCSCQSMPTSKLQILWQVSLEVHSTSEDAITELFIRLFGDNISPSAWQLHESPRVKVSFYTVDLPASAQAIRTLIKQELLKLAEAGLDVSSPKLSIRRIKKENWAESWKRHFPVLTFDKKLMIAPSWSKRKAFKNMVRLVLDPGLSFGTGHHPTTSYCLSQVVKYAPTQGGKASMLDIGCGTGILSIAAARLGYSPVFGFDNDEEAIQNSIKNAARNQAEELISFKTLGIEKMSLDKNDVWDLVCANLEAPLLIEMAKRIAAKIASNGKLVVAGILAHQFEAVQKAYSEQGFCLEDSSSGGEWTSGTLMKK
ncbi:MAG: 50S ribosomal protein L11 methyltransferase [Verrucomicrobiae bacterium]|nr:50S ribosomal protein L11 methyltransferase [Verrucomicrobiae bacterium]